MKMFKRGDAIAIRSTSQPGSTALTALALGAVVVAAAMSAPSTAHAQVNVSIGVNQPGVYGRVDFGDAPPPRVIYPQPVIIQQPPVLVERRPIYLRVPPGYEANWGRYCGRYSACGQPVYFVRDDPRPPPPPRAFYRRDDHRFDHGPERRDFRDHDRRDDRHDDRRDDRGGPPGHRGDR